MDPTPIITVDDQFFLGRVEEQKQFRAALAEVLMQPNQEKLPFIFLLYGIGGMGKTTLAKRFRDIALMEPPFEGNFQVLWIDWEEEARRSAALQVGREHVSPETVFDLVHAAAVREEWGRHFGDYQKVLKARAEVDKEAANALASGGERDELEPIRAAGATVAAKLLRTAAPAIGDPGEKLAEELVKAGVKVGAEQAVRLRSLAETRLRARLNAKQYQLFLEPHEQLARALGEGLSRLARGKWVLVVLDTYEIVDRVDTWLRVVMRAAGSRVVWIVSGRNNLRDSRQFGAEYFRGYADEFPRRLVAHDMAQLAAEYVHEYFASCAPDRPVGEVELEALGRATRGIPLAVRLAAEMWQVGVTVEAITGDIDDAKPHLEIVRTVTDRYLMHAVAPADRLALFALALADGDLEELRAMLRPDEAATYDLNAHLRRLERNYSSVHAETARLHDEAAFFFRERLRRQQQRNEDTMRHLNERGAAALRARLAMHEQELPLIEDRCDDDDWVRDAIRLADRLFWIEEELGWRWLIPRYVEALAYSRKFRHGLKEVADNWQKLMGTRGKKRVKALAALNQWFWWPIDEDVLAGLDELDRLSQLGLLAGDCQDERRAILSLYRGRVLLRSGDTTSALACFEATERGLPEEGEALRRQLGDALDQLAQELLWPAGNTSIRNPELAVQTLRKVVGWLPENTHAWHRLGTTLSNDGQQVAAVEVFQQAIALNGTVAHLHQGLGDVYGRLGRNQEAISAYRHALVLDPNASGPFNELGTVYRALNQYKEAVSAYERAIDLDSRNAISFYGLGIIYYIQDKFDEAITAFQQSNELAAKWPAPYAALAATYRKLDDETAYQHYIELAQPLMQREDEYNRACFACTCGDVNEALALLQTAIAKAPGMKLLARQTPYFDFIRDDPRFQALVDEQGATPYEQPVE